MKHNRLLQKAAYGLTSAMLLLASAASAATEEAPKVKKFLTKPLVIEDQGSFFIGGVPKVTNYATVPGPNQTAAPNQITIGQMYVQFEIPEKKKPKMPPVIMVHGSSHTAACLESTPDGREGWYPYFVRKGISTYLVDQAGRGRSGFDESVIHEAEAAIKGGDVQKGTAMLPSFGRITDNGAWTAWFGHLIPAGSTILTGTLIRHGDPGDPPDDDALHNDTYRPAYPLGAVDANIVARNGAIAQAPAGPNNYYALEYYKQLVPNAEVTLPGSTCPTCDPTTIAPANTWTPMDLALLVERLGGAVVATHSIRNHGASHGPHPEGARSSGFVEGPDHDRGVLFSSEQRPEGGGLRQHPLPGLEGRLHGHQRGVSIHRGRDQRPPRRRPRNREGGLPQAG